MKDYKHYTTVTDWFINEIATWDVHHRLTALSFIVKAIATQEGQPHQTIQRVTDFILTDDNEMMH